MTTSPEMQAAVAKAIVNMDRLNRVINGDMDELVDTDNSQIPSLAKIVGSTGYTATAVQDARDAADRAESEADRAESVSQYALVLSRYYEFMVTAISDLAVGELFVSDNFGPMNVYKRIAASPFYQFIQAVGAVKSVEVSGGSTGFTFSGGPITNSGVLQMEGLLSVGSGGTGGNTPDTARNSLNAAKKGVNSDITELQGLTTPLSMAQGGTGVTTPEALLAAIGAAPATSAVPTGAVFHFAMNAAPSGYLVCNGAAVSRTTYAALFTAIGTTFGTGDGSTTFNLPDLRAEFIRGWDNGRNVDTGRAFGSAQSQQLAKHKHVSSFGEKNVSGQFGTITRNNMQGSGGGVDNDNNQFLTNDGSDFFGQTVNTSGVVGDETRPRNVALLPCIKT